MKIDQFNEEAKRSEQMAMAIVKADFFRPTEKGAKRGRG
jgi:hypothetical protein